MNVDIHFAAPEDSALIAGMALALTEEISAAMGERHFDLKLDATAALCRDMLEEGRYVALLAFADGACAGFVGLSEGRALYAGGALATMEEFYVAPAFRSRGIGSALLGAVVRLAAERGWKRLEVCTPPLPQFDRSLAFYARNGFVVTGGRKMKRAP